MAPLGTPSPSGSTPCHRQVRDSLSPRNRRDRGAGLDLLERFEDLTHCVTLDVSHLYDSKRASHSTWVTVRRTGQGVKPHGCCPSASLFFQS